MSEEPSLPRLPAVSWDDQPQNFLSGSRKRGRAQRFLDDNAQNFNSSDPAVFSSDDDPGLDNYVEGRRKKRYIGSWFQQHPASSDSAFGDGIPKPKPKRKLARQVDSGVFLGSDGAESEDMLEVLEVPVRARLPQLERPPIPRMSSIELALQKKISKCLEDGSETVDFWSMGLEELSNDTVAPLSQLTCIPQITKDVAFEQKEPDLKIYLAQNLLSRLPGALFDLVNLTTLSLRGNRLTELPPAISRLQNLRELNVSLNRLRYLPMEMLELLDTADSLHSVVLHPNPFLQPESLSVDATAAYDESLSFRRSLKDARPYFISQHLCRSPRQLTNSSGAVLSDFTIPPEVTKVPVPVETLSSTTAPEGSSRSSAVPSLVEVALRSCYASFDLPDLASYIPDGLSHLRQLLDRAVQQKESGGLFCSGCQKLIIIPTVQWIEWRAVYAGETRPNSNCVANGEFAVPFIHRSCSERCGPIDERGAHWRPSR
ncbi:Glucose-repressible alcohol dehydrogenase transcriptional effector [Paramyrothecium foliicola]|nr:Glucose-repressible alcohol dehydrogenase transcriptional effector [Paramyrothecium foliicola]